MTKFTNELFVQRFAPLVKRRSETLRILVLSDTHGSAHALERAVSRCGQIDAAIHLGDIVSDALYLEKLIGDVPCAFVRGNCDGFSAAPDVLTLTIGGVPFLCVHGHEDSVKYDRLELYYHALECEARVALYGHTHVSDIDRNGSVWLINPGSASQPRISRAPTCAIVEVRDALAYPGILPL